MPQQSAIEVLVALALCGGLAAVTGLLMAESHKRLDDPDDDRTLHLDQLATKHQLQLHGTYRITIYRQSGNIHAERFVTGNGAVAVADALASFRRAKIDAVHVASNTDTKLIFGRLYHDHRGRAEGKKIGRAEIELVAKETADSAPPVSKRLEVTCNCGEHTAVPLNALHLPIKCPACSADNSLTLAQIMQAKTAAEAAERRAQDRHASGEPGRIAEAWDIASD